MPSSTRKPWWGAPEDAIGHAVALNRILARLPGAVVVISTIVAFRIGFEVRVFALRSTPEDLEIADPTWRGSGAEPRPQYFQLDVELADGRRGRSADPWPEGDEAPSQPHVRSLIGVVGPPGSFVGGWDLRFWVWPLPPPGSLKLFCRWPVAAIERAQLELQADRVLEAAERSFRL